MKALIYKSALVSFIFLCFFGLSSKGQTVTITSANSVATNGVSSSPMVNGQKDAVVLGFKVAVSGGSVNFNQFVLTANQGLATNGRLYRSTAGSVSFSGATQIATLSAGYYMAIGVNETITNSSYTYFLVVDINATGALPATIQFSFGSAIRNSPYTSYGSGFNGINYTVNNPTLTITDANASSNGITQGDVLPGQTGVVLFGFGLSANANATVSTVNINTSSTQSYLASYLGNGKLYRSSSSTFSLLTATQVNPATVSFSTYQHTPGVTISGMSEAVTTTTAYYFLVADFNQTAGTLPSNIQFKFQTSQTNALILSNASNITASSNITGASFKFTNPTYTITDANSGANGITQGNLVPSETGIVLFGFGVSTNAAATVTGFNLNNTGTSVPASYFNNGKIYRSTSSTFSTGTATLLNTASVSFTSGSTPGLTISGLNESYTANAAPVYYFIVGDFYSGYYGTVPGTTQFKFATSTSNSIVQSSPISSNVAVASDVNGTNFSLALPSVTITGYNSASNGITQGALSYGQTAIVLFGFKVDVTGILTINQIDIPSSVSTNAYFTQGKLYRSATPYFADAVNTGASVSFPGTSTSITGLSQNLNSFTGNGSYYYFLVADFTASTSYSTGTLQYNFVNGTASLTQSSPYKQYTNLSTSNGNIFTIAATYDWVGSSSTSFTDAGNYRTLNGGGGATPGTNDVVRIGVVAYQYPYNQPTVSASKTIRGITFGNNNAPVLTINTTQTLTLSNGVTVNASSTGTITSSGTGKLAISSGATSSVASGGTLQLTGSAQLNNAGDMSVAGTLTVAGATTNSGTITNTGSNGITFSAAVTNTGTITQSAAGTFTTSGTFTNNSGGSLNLASGTGTFAALTNNAGGTVTLGTGNVTFSGAVTNNSTFNAGAGIMDVTGNFTNTGAFTAGSGNINFNSTTFTNDVGGTFTGGAGTIVFKRTNVQAINNNAATAFTFNDVTFSNTGGTNRIKTLGGTGAGFGVASTGKLTLSGKVTLATGGVLTLKSDTSGSATVTELPSGTSITGNVNVERYITGGKSYSRGYRLLSSAVSESSSLAVWPNLSYPKTQSWITGTSGSGGFSNSTPANPSIYAYRENLVPAYTSFISGNFRGINKINNTPAYNINLDGEVNTFTLPAGNGILFFFRGGPATTNPTDPQSVAQPATFTSTGYLNQGAITVTHWTNAGGAGKLLYTDSIANTAVRGYNLVGNPYASSIDWDKFGTAAISGTHIDSTIRIYNPRLKAYATYIAGHAGVGTNFDNSALSNANVIPSGQAFFVRATDKNPTLTFTEAAKVNTQLTASSVLMSAPNQAGQLNAQQLSRQTLMGTAAATTAAAATMAAPTVTKPPVQYLRLQVIQDDNNKEESLVFFKSTAKPTFAKNEDAEYLKGNNVISLSTRSTDNKELAINELPYPAKSLTIPLTVKVPATGIYQLNLNELKNVPQLYSIWLMDKWRKDSLDIGTNKTYNFNATLSDTATYGANRFALVIRQNPDYALTLLKFSASKATSGAELSWTTENESDYTGFVVERSTDNGKTWEVVSSLKSTGNGDYTLTDRFPVIGKNQYRLKTTDLNGEISYSEIRELMYSKQGQNIVVSNINIYPNPVTTTVNVAILPQEGATSYTITVTSGNGSVVRSVTTTNTVWQNNVNNLLPGTYFVQVINNGNKTVVGNGKFVKN
ncbi:T9SS type A sorting domain-containing protein [Mucilaginibacter sp. AK015]|uniref:T9SS type A sorting domain-containing protein n=1 Tax=Mucilaginibacter sp. AK015 TaxID=2723072 RepID=UPI00161861F8|nr:T9SS type A sorting domain-containing protein [Mucilaginibacter sp. AK015]MBB5395726.1 hypothetical protein [Mucilaginibacter sp. AK015]